MSLMGTLQKDLLRSSQKNIVIIKLIKLGLDNDTKAKLQVLIQSHMSRLLMRIDEENQSVSEKSSTYNLS